jgi:predicted DsbA family dithiol-disulfide isomerase
VRGTNSELAAAAALAAQKQGKWREMHIALMRVPANAFTQEVVDTIAKSVGLDMNRYKADMASKEVKERIARAVQDYANVGLEGTPTSSSTASMSAASAKTTSTRSSVRPAKS